MTNPDPGRRTARPLALTAAHVARVHRVLEDVGVEAGAQLQTDADYDGWVDKLIGTHPPGATWLFAYGSLIWKPEVEHVDERHGSARGWHRSFCFRMRRFRGTPDRPGLMLALDRGGQCRGVLYRFPDGDQRARFGKLFRREFTYKPANTVPRWITVDTAEGAITALAFVMNRASPNYAGRLSLDEIADVLAASCGHWGTGAEYLMNTVAHLEERGLCDRNLWRLQKMVAERIAAAEA